MNRRNKSHRANFNFFSFQTSALRPRFVLKNALNDEKSRNFNRKKMELGAFRDVQAIFWPNAVPVIAE